MALSQWQSEAGEETIVDGERLEAGSQLSIGKLQEANHARILDQW
jgi:hypothetical protein